VPIGPPYYDSAVKFWSGQDVVPVYEGWVPNHDGTFTMVFGYFNRNYREELVIPPGPNNNVAPGNLDQGQPTIFEPRRQAWIFRVNVPRDFGDRQVVWTLTSHGRTEKTVGQLIRQLQISERSIMSHGNLDPGLNDPNERPSIHVLSAGETKVGVPVELTALVADDGLPEASDGTSSEGSTSATGQSNSVDPPVRLTASWMAYRGPGGVVFEDKGPTVVAYSKVATSAQFSEPGTYVLIATADDGELATPTTFTVKVSR
jgi:hypothetical protein